jgi:hypothetical protein
MLLGVGIAVGFALAMVACWMCDGREHEAQVADQSAPREEAVRYRLLPAAGRPTDGGARPVETRSLEQAQCWD